ncbi:MAG: aspartate kinase [Candidatus Diapherotrites archaeon]|uniref:Aspartokinase n=1 Tax=Candidatus Iainarchaeum sp. TaxID=3101447 RepID=A0A8T4LCW5_9ARCH|nr:aspartate kinase [Candidatus Diapherotrites archaeon]
MRTVMKFGGSVLRTSADLRRLATILEPRLACGEQIILVNSALQGVTDQLIATAERAGKDRLGILESMKSLQARHLSALEGVEAGKAREWCLHELRQGFQRLECALHNVHAMHGLLPRAADPIYAFGERFAARLIVAHLQEAGIQAKAYDADEAGLMVEDHVEGARPIMPLTCKNFRKIVARLRHGEVPVITGYFGMDGNGNVVCLGRGGTDYSAAIVANAVDANRLELWKDVGGLYSADPKRVWKARPLRELNYDEAEELSRFGAKILHPKTISPLREKGIEAWIRSVHEPCRTGTRIHAKPFQFGRAAEAFYTP